ncbi:hypothetical protein Hanom_Chr01g00075541 [Helianthus anomalus]
MDVFLVPNCPAVFVFVFRTCEICNSIVSNLVEMPMPCSTHHVVVLDVNLEAATPHGSLTTTRGGG